MYLTAYIGLQRREIGAFSTCCCRRVHDDSEATHVAVVPGRYATVAVHKDHGLIETDEL